MANKKKWWWSSGDNFDKDKYSNSIKQHQEKLNKQKRLFDEDGIEILEEDDYGSYKSPYADDYWGFDKALNKKEEEQEYEEGEDGEYKRDENGNVIPKKKAQKQFDDEWDSYSKTGVWKGYGYYRESTLGYRYIQQIANAIALDNDVEIEVGNVWELDLEKKKLWYNPTTLMYGTKSELLATLLHEIGKIRHSTPMSQLQSEFIKKYGTQAYITLGVFEDVRVDVKMLKSYDSAEDVYESAIPSVIEQMKMYEQMGEQLRRYVVLEARHLYRHFMDQMGENEKVDLMSKVRSMLGNNPQMAPGDRAIIEQVIAMQNQTSMPTRLTASQKKAQKDLQKYFGTSNPNEVEDKIRQLEQDIKTTPFIYDYCAGMLVEGYELTQKTRMDVSKYVDPTKQFIPPYSTMQNTAEVLQKCDTEVFPVVEELFKEMKEGTESMKKLFGAEGAESIMNMARSSAGTANLERQFAKGKSSQAGKNSGSGRSQENLPKEWARGDYKALRESVDSEIKLLVQRLTFLRRQEQVVTWNQNQKRGKLNMKKLYSFATGNRRLFKKKLENIDTVRSFCFSVMVDISGSMQGSKIIHTTRALVMLGEVFNKMQIPFEVIVFDQNAKHIKKFDSPLNEPVKSKIGGVATMADGGTQLVSALELTQIKMQPEINKVVVVLSDGDTEPAKDMNKRFFQPWLEKLNIKSMMFAIEEGSNDLKDHCNGNGKLVDNATKIPEVFTELLKSLIKKK